MKKIKAVLFDMDGLMIDTEPLHLQAFNEVLKHYGKYLTEEENSERYLGLSDKDEAEDMILRFDLPISAEKLCNMKSKSYKQFLKNKLVAKPGLVKLLTELSQNEYQIAIASSSALEEIETVIGRLNINSLINAYCSAQEVDHGKPAPDVYLLVAKKLRVQSKECLVLEDAPRGVQAGKAAGMTVFAIPSQYTKGQDFSQADKVLNSLSEVFNLL